MKVEQKLNQLGFTLKTKDFENRRGVWDVYTDGKRDINLAVHLRGMEL